MGQTIISYLQFGNHFCGIEHTLKGDQCILYTTVLKKNKKEVDVEDSFSVDDIKTLSSKLSKNQHVTLVINNEQVLTKSVIEPQTDDLKLVNKGFPNINITDFYYEIVNQNTVSFVSICRKEYINKLISDYSNIGIHVVSFSLGNSMISSSFKYIDSAKINTSNAIVSYNADFIEAIAIDENIEKESYDINGLKTTNLHILSLSASLSGIVNNYASTNNFQEKKNYLIKSYKQLRFFNQILKGGLAFILGLLLINFLFFNYYFNNVATLNETSQLNQTTKNKIVKLSEEVNKAKKMTDDILKSSASKSSFYVNDIIQSLPKSILLSEINYQPLEKNIKPDKPIKNKKNTIIVSGESNDSDKYSNWIALLETMAWVDKISVESYSDSKTRNSRFSIKIEIKP